MSEIYAGIYKIVQSIPKGRVLTYGLISHMIGGRMSAQGVGWALKALGSAKRSDRSAKKSTADAPYNSSTVPWQRVVNAQGGTSTHKLAGIPPGFQQHLLELEGIKFDHEGKLDLDKYLWIEGVSKDE
ncbi:MAG TPA: MGMT family protein [Trichormus sp.]|jgi:methylated-DNA-protein-cysteine methyltransferase-like protein